MDTQMKILIVDDEANMRRVLEVTLKDQGYSVLTAGNGKEALEIMRTGPAHVIITDLRMPGMDGFTLLKEVNLRYPDVPVIIITAHGTVENAVEAMKHGAADYILKPFDIEELKISLKKACSTYLINTREFHHQDVVNDGGIIAASEKIKDILKMINKVADSPSTILISGESGTGKELIAQLIHYRSSRADGPFIRINCAAVPETLLESEFFGYEKGAFTGAVSSKPGRFELADKGTLFLDEIGEISKEMQVKLLRVLQEREFERVGGLKTIKVDVRLIVASNRDLSEEVEKGRFRRDLFYRLNVVPIHLPPLRERPEDIPPLVHHFIAFFNKRLNRQVKGISHEAMHLLMQYHWPGNIRELENALERAILLSNGDFLTPDTFPDIRVDTSPSAKRQVMKSSLKEIIRQETERIEKQVLESVLSETGGNVTRTAKLLGLSRKGLQLKMKKYGLQSADFQNKSENSS